MKKSISAIMIIVVLFNFIFCTSPFYCIINIDEEVIKKLSRFGIIIDKGK